MCLDRGDQVLNVEQVSAPDARHIEVPFQLLAASTVMIWTLLGMYGPIFRISRFLPKTASYQGRSLGQAPRGKDPNVHGISNEMPSIGARELKDVGARQGEGGDRLHRIAVIE